MEGPGAYFRDQAMARNCQSHSACTDEVVGAVFSFGGKDIITGRVKKDVDNVTKL